MIARINSGDSIVRSSPNSPPPPWCRPFRQPKPSTRRSASRHRSPTRWTAFESRSSNNLESEQWWLCNSCQTPGCTRHLTFTGSSQLSIAGTSSAMPQWGHDFDAGGTQADDAGPESPLALDAASAAGMGVASRSGSVGRHSDHLPVEHHRQRHGQPVLCGRRTGGLEELGGAAFRIGGSRTTSSPSTSHRCRSG